MLLANEGNRCYINLQCKYRSQLQASCQPKMTFLLLANKEIDVNIGLSCKSVASDHG